MVQSGTLLVNRERHQLTTNGTLPDRFQLVGGFWRLCSTSDLVYPNGVTETINKAVVLGAGTMGSQIAALLAGHGIPCDLLDLASDGVRRSRLAEDAIRRLPKLRPSPVFAEADLALIRSGNFSDDLSRVGETDWVVEAVTEDLDVKRDLWSRVAGQVRPDVLVSTNTSGIPIRFIAEALPPPLRAHFLGTHFFNPPRYLKLLEVIAGPDTSPEVVATATKLAEGLLDRRVVLAHDVPGFIANRLWAYGTLATLRAAERLGLGPDEVDGITGRAMGRPNSATFRTLDLVGLDVFISICDNMQDSLSDPDDKAAFKAPSYLREMVARGWTGEKTGQGFYKRTELAGERQILALDPGTFEYQPRRGVSSASLEAALDENDPSRRLKRLTNSDDRAARLAWASLSPLMAYAARNVGVAADDIAGIDRAMTWGFGWELGLFDIWDTLGVAETVARMKSDGLAIPDWVETLAGRSTGFYRNEAERKVQFMTDGHYAPLPAD